MWNKIHKNNTLCVWYKLIKILLLPLPLFFVMSLPMHVRGPPSYYICLAIASYLCLRWAFIGINSSLIRPHYELPIAMVASSRKKKSRQGITIRKNKQPVSIDQSSNSHVNRTDSAHSNNVRSASNMIPCFPANNSTDVYHCDIVLFIFT